MIQYHSRHFFLSITDRGAYSYPVIRDQHVFQDVHSPCWKKLLFVLYEADDEVQDYPHEVHKRGVPAHYLGLLDCILVQLSPSRFTDCTITFLSSSMNLVVFLKSTQVSFHMNMLNHFKTFKSVYQ